MQQAKSKQKAEQANMMANAEAMKYSPWTGMNPGMMQASGGSPALAGLSGGLQGAVSGAGLGQQFSKTTPIDPGVMAAQTQLDQTAGMPMTQLDALQPGMPKKKNLYDPSGFGSWGRMNT
jgi:hypothetical protein